MIFDVEPKIQGHHSEVDLYWLLQGRQQKHLEASCQYFYTWEGLVLLHTSWESDQLEAVRTPVFGL